MAALPWRGILLAIFAVHSGWILPSSAGEVWPLPRNQTNDGRTLYINTHKFHFKCTGYTSDILHRAFKRYGDLIFRTPGYRPASTGRDIQRVGALHGSIKRLRVHVSTYDQSLALDMDESYTLRVDSPTSTLEAPTVFGALRGLETFSQLVDRVEVQGNEVPRGPAGTRLWSWSAELHGSISQSGAGKGRALLAQESASTYYPGLDMDEEGADEFEGLPPMKIALAVDAGAGGGVDQNPSKEGLDPEGGNVRARTRASAALDEQDELGKKVVRGPIANDRPGVEPGDAEAGGEGGEGQGLSVGAGSGVGVGIVVERPSQPGLDTQHHHHHHKKKRHKASPPLQHAHAVGLHSFLLL